ncbi:hypothetical protein DFH94DRAFT_445206 [Russula ochroleuca]|jgi:hypothetical protein|uniref:Uncharacterized protein n=1 Tax=Russula ochroleuca TaxID=152965 RepID=A0A9P5TAA3_9AGAM|nr:hypothetical protein DFH94DRAFT_445206 [Russula ochroleuca]
MPFSLAFNPQSCCRAPLSLPPTMVSPAPSFPGAWPDLSLSDIVPPLPDKFIPQDTQDISPSLVCLSPRPLAELPSLSSSLSTADSSVTSRSPTPSGESCSLVEVQPTCTPLQTHSTLVLDLREPRSPDSAHFSPLDDASSFASPSSSQLQLSLSNNCPGTQSVESVATYLPSPSRPSTPDAEQGGREDEGRRPDQRGGREDDESPSDPPSYGDRHEHSPHVTKISIDKRTFLSRVKRFGGRVRKLFKPRVLETKPRHGSVSSLLPARKPPFSVSVRLPTGPESPRSRLDPETASILPRRFSLQTLLHSRLPSGSADSGSRTMGNRLSTIVSAQDDDWLSPLNTHSPDAAAADVPETDHSQADRDNYEQKVEDQIPVTTTMRHGLGIGAPEPISVTNRDSG